MSDNDANYLASLERLWEMVSDMVEGGRLTEGMIPDDYDAICSQMVTCNADLYQCQQDDDAEGL